MAENHTKTDSIGLQLQVECWYEPRGTTKSMIQLNFPSTIEAQTRTVTFLTIKSVVRKIQKNDDQTGSCAWTRQCLDKGRGGGG